MRLIFLVCFSFLLSCGRKAGVPKGVLAVPQMTDVLWDVMRADEVVTMHYPLDTGTVRFDTSLLLYRQIAKQHNTTQQQFKQSLEFYKTRPDLMQAIIDTLTARANLPAPTIDSTIQEVLPVE